MSTEDRPVSQGDQEPEPEWKRRRRLAAVFGDTVPEQTSDDRDPSEPAAGKGDDWYRAEVPPHHG
ncbi:hypothetical protein ASG76_01105 [Nocardioides sp. Soil774]|uniref:hypothetical protein n=1 Tax=Nocardioides sp. Soil774 TaxID=1736408 RepID=UPI000701F3AA|nr:hypothetical protein [Nocardioides sp. Soil774]KRE97355.1 hypothetical protein ASG76_01105 [Nocardioides sp. Soil774]